MLLMQTTCPLPFCSMLGRKASIVCSIERNRYTNNLISTAKLHPYPEVRENIDAERLFDNVWILIEEGAMVQYSSVVNQDGYFRYPNFPHQSHGLSNLQPLRHIHHETVSLDHAKSETTIESMFRGWYLSAVSRHAAYRRSIRFHVYIPTDNYATQRS